MKTFPLRVFVRRVLWIRLGLATLLMALLTGVATYFVQQERLTREVADIGRQGIAGLSRRVMELVDATSTDPVSALRQVLEASAASPATYDAGRFVIVQFHTPAGEVVAEATVADPRLPAAQALAQGWPFSLPPGDRVEADLRRVGEERFLLNRVPLIDRQGGVRGYARGVFAVSTDAVARMRRAVLQSVAIVVAIVCSVTLILYPVILRLVRRLADFSTQLLDANLETLAVLGSAIAKRDADTDAHNYRVSLYAARLGEAVGLGAEAMQGLIKGAFIHDVGKIGIPDAILLKPGRLDTEEVRVMQTHVGLGVDIVRRASWLRDSIPVVAAHHEQFAGGGYPAGVRAEEIPLPARIFAIADVFDALTSQRPYKKPLTFEETMKILATGRGVHFDPALLDLFAGIARELFEQYAGSEGDQLRRELVAVVGRYFSAGLEALDYGKKGA